MSDYLEIKIIDQLFDADGTGNYTAPSTYHIELYTSAPSDSGGGTPVSGTGTAYVRKEITKGSSHWTRAANVVSNTNTVSFAVPTADWGRVTHFGIFDASTSGNLILHGSLANAKNINLGDPAPKFSAGELKFTID